MNKLSDGAFYAFIFVIFAVLFFSLGYAMGYGQLCDFANFNHMSLPGCQEVARQ